MRTAVDQQLRDESERFAFRFTCEHCAHLADAGRCSLGYPSEPHHLIELRREPAVEFCKSFELA